MEASWEGRTMDYSPSPMDDVAVESDGSLYGDYYCMLILGTVFMVGLIVAGPLEAYFLQSPDFVSLFFCFMLFITCVLGAFSRQRTRIGIQFIVPGSLLMVRLRRKKTIPWSDIDRIKLTVADGGWKALLYARRGFPDFPQDIRSEQFDRPVLVLDLIRTHMTDKDILESEKSKPSKS